MWREKKKKEEEGQKTFCAERQLDALVVATVTQTEKERGCVKKFVIDATRSDVAKEIGRKR